MQAAPVEDQEDGRENGQRIGGGRVIKNPHDPFQRRQGHFAPDFDERRPRPTGRRQDLAEIDVGRPLERSESGELKNRISETEQSKGEPDSFETRDAPEPVTQRERGSG